MRMRTTISRAAARARTYLRTPVTQGQNTVLVEDLFLDANATALTAHAIAPINKLSLAWTAVTSTFEIQSNHAIPTSTSNAVAKVNPAVADVQLESDIVPLAGVTANQFGFRARMNGTSWWNIGVAAGPIVIIQEKTTVRASASVTLNNGDPYALKARLLADAISANLAGVDIAYTSNVNQTITQHAIQSPGNNIGKFKNFKVTKL